MQLGNVEELTDEKLLSLGKIDLLIGEVLARIYQLSILIEKSIVEGYWVINQNFFEYVRVKNIINPTYFLLENVESMSDSDKDIITEILELNQ